MSLDKSLLKDLGGYLEGDSSAISKEELAIAIDYKRRVSGSFSPINLDQVEEKLAGSDLCVTRKLDGELMVVFYKDGIAFGVNTGGKVRTGLPCLDEITDKLKAQKIKSAIIAAELYAEESNGRSRVYDVVAALGKGGDCSSLNIAVFDIIKLNDETLRPEHYRQTHEKLSELFSGGDKVQSVPMEETGSRKEAADIAKKWIDDEGAEGVVIYSELSRIFKVKPKHTFDVVIVGYTEGDGDNCGKIRDLLFALRHDDGAYQVIGKTGNGFTEEEKTDFFNKLSGQHVESQYLETDSRNIAYHMVKPEIVIEVSANDLLTESSKGPKQNPVLGFESGYNAITMAPGVSLIHPVFERRRDDKTPDPALVNFKQVAELIYLPTVEGKSISELPQSEVLIREAYVKASKGQKMVQKFLVWQTNKSDLDSTYPAFVMHYTNFSPSRKDPLKRDVRVSASKEQIMQIKDQFFEKNIKKGWEKIS